MATISSHWHVTYVYLLGRRPMDLPNRVRCESQVLILGNVAFKMSLASDSRSVTFSRAMIGARSSKSYGSSPACLARRFTTLELSCTMSLGLNNANHSSGTFHLAQATTTWLTFLPFPRPGKTARDSTPRRYERLAIDYHRAPKFSRVIGGLFGKVRASFHCGAFQPAL